MPSRVGRRGRLVRLLLKLQALYTIVGAWISDNIVGPWTSLWEEITKVRMWGAVRWARLAPACQITSRGPCRPTCPTPQAVVRGWIITWQRWLNAWSGILLALFPGARREVRGRPRAHSEAWGAWLKGGCDSGVLGELGRECALLAVERASDAAALDAPRPSPPNRCADGIAQVLLSTPPPSQVPRGRSMPCWSRRA